MVRDSQPLPEWSEVVAQKDAETLAREVDRLRAALNGVVREWEEYTADEHSGDVPFIVGVTMAGIARAALTQPAPRQEEDMSDLVEWLRNGACHECCHRAEQAADEITRLTAEVERLTSGYQGACYACEPVGELNIRLTARVEELEGALRAAYEVYAGSDGFIPETAAEGYQQQIIRQMVDCISAAISPAQPTPMENT